jgi:hypothetical protein
VKNNKFMENTKKPCCLMSTAFSLLCAWLLMILKAFNLPFDSAGQNHPVANGQGGPMLPLGIFRFGPGRHTPTFLGRSVIDGSNDVATGGAPVFVGALPAPLAGAGAAVEAEIHIINAMGLATGDFIPICSDLPNLMAAALVLNLLGAGNGLGHNDLLENSNQNP